MTQVEAKLIKQTVEQQTGKKVIEIRYADNGKLQIITV